LTFEVKTRNTVERYIVSLPKKIPGGSSKTFFMVLVRIQFMAAAGIKRDWHYGVAEKYTGSISLIPSPHFIILTKRTRLSGFTKFFPSNKHTKSMVVCSEPHTHFIQKPEYRKSTYYK
jgi:hypothetical protein